MGVATKQLALKAVDGVVEATVFVAPVRLGLVAVTKDSIEDDGLLRIWVVFSLSPTVCVPPGNIDGPDPRELKIVGQIVVVVVITRVVTLGDPSVEDRFRAETSCTQMKYIVIVRNA
jgi:hypothetical protein